MNASIIKRYFSDLPEEQWTKFIELGPLFEMWNQKVNVISRKDIHHLYDRHILHSLGIAKYIRFNPGCRILDIGTGGGFPGIPLAILFPTCQFTLIDGRHKKIHVIQNIVEELKLDNIKAIHLRAEECKMHFDFVTARAVTNLKQLCRWAFPLVQQTSKKVKPGGLLALKGGDIEKEIQSLDKQVTCIRVSLSTYFEEEYYYNKWLLHLTSG